ncbi:Beta-hexosaminidase [Rhynchospora pubera]|uniref:Beta-hexosaminidase n=1 Tax=Rhynchospora pubera TaxID=906938 RepID=A0AAV8H195_9POAL|nr:Beta-hexosaminidase [Rhynchospora pubera]
MNCLRGFKSLLYGFFFSFVLSIWVRVHGQNIWPMPKSVSFGNRTLSLSSNFELRTYRSNYLDSSGILNEAFERMMHLVKAGHMLKTDFPDSGIQDSVDIALNTFDDMLTSLPVLAGINIAIRSPNETLNFGIDESYYLYVPDTGSILFARVEAATVFGALHALETFSQLCNFNFTTKALELHSAPLTIYDQPRFPYRGLLIDTSRHYLPVAVIKSVIDSMSYSKLNVLHWHIVDDQSFPIEVPSYPKLWKGAYSNSERYTIEDAAEIVKYAEQRGVNVLAEIDVPGHTSSWGFGYRSLWPSNGCRNPLDVSNEFAFEIIDGILLDFRKVFKFKFVHLGGDEVFMGKAPYILLFYSELNDNNMTLSDGYRYFVLRAQNIAISHGYDIINWEETFNNFGGKLSPKTVVHNWLGQGVAQKVVAAGLRCIVSNQDRWYLDHLDVPWQHFYANEPLTNITDPNQRKLVLGGEVCMWGEQIDTSNIQRTIWPRAAAAAERLWTPLEKLPKNPREVALRLAHFRCLLNQRGIQAAPLDGYSRNGPQDPGSCINQ